ncbi:polysaccharide deacetylase family protein [Roseicyclus sp.]|jgi:allantoinase|uniref:polysaccharide deacetylase family protein n=1 Tax=Roseicyclus sp. TaxID=1914329 RepID=UPI003BAFE1A2
MEIRQHDRYEFSALPDRPTYTWPGGKRLAVSLCNNIEWFSFMSGLGSDHTLPGAAQTTRNYAWRDYGNRVGIWYLFDLLDELGLPCSHNVNAAALAHCPQIVARIISRGDEVIGHGLTNSERQDIMDEATERAMIAATSDTIAQHFGARPKGWLGPYIVQSPATLDLLKEAGYTYTLDWPADDQPFWMRTKTGPILSVPYSIELNDSPAQVFRHHTGVDFEQMIVDHFDEMLLQSEKYPLVFNIVMHPFVIGQPFRLRALRRALDHILAQRDDLWITTPGGIAAYVATLPEGTLP